MFPENLIEILINDYENEWKEERYGHEIDDDLNAISINYKGQDALAFRLKYDLTNVLFNNLVKYKTIRIMNSKGIYEKYQYIGLVLSYDAHKYNMKSDSNIVILQKYDEVKYIKQKKVLHYLKNIKEFEFISTPLTLGTQLYMEFGHSNYDMEKRRKLVKTAKSFKEVVEEFRDDVDDDGRNILEKHIVENGEFFQYYSDEQMQEIRGLVNERD